MQRTISAMVGKGSVNHNSRKFRAENVDGTRTHLNIDYCNENIKTVYHELFDEALERYNAKQIRSDRKIKDYYEKIRSSKQEKPFHEIILQVGGKGNMNADTENGELAKQILDCLLYTSREMMGVSRDTAYRMIRSLRSDLIADGQLAKGYPSGKIPKKAFNKLYMIE